MGFWSKFKKAVKKIAKKVWQKVKAVARTVSRIIIEALGRLVNVVDLLFGFATWPSKYLRLHIAVLRQADGTPVVDPVDLDVAIEHVRKVLKEQLNIKLKPYGKTFVEVLDQPAPDYALNVSCNGGALKEEYGNAGEYFAGKLAGWNGVPITVKFPITAFIVQDVKDKAGCSLGPLSDYVTVDPNGVKNISTLMHEIGHACGLWHVGSSSNLMKANLPRGEDLRGWQKNMFRSSRHVTYW